MIQKRYEGFLKTAPLWKGNSVFNLFQIEIHSEPDKISFYINEKLRLGKYVECLVSYELKQQKDISILAENIQIQKDKTTLGELDCLLLKNNTPIHLEIVYKFYLYDSAVGENEIEHCIGPNRKDSLKEKLQKLKNKQLPLLYTIECENYLNKLKMHSKDISQQVCFKAQLFVPFSKQNLHLKTLNTDCIVGFYIRQNQLDNFRECKFYIPSKKDWLIIPHTHVKWLNFISFKDISQIYVEKKFSPMCWVKQKNGTIKKMFLVWW
ncbi:DUF1853 family protein [uncultured Maribacter sp.]|uniref:DUF1853 family protein n=1 Tax=uncultured Maribacter sp. TaxID=431308 RepID=UPI00261218F7|nr:DUF1853 family protein [uncultured Maribacter sp.]